MGVSKKLILQCFVYDNGSHTKRKIQMCVESIWGILDKGNIVFGEKTNNWVIQLHPNNRRKEAEHMKVAKIFAILFLVMLFGGCKMQLAENHMGGIFANQTEKSGGERADAVKEELGKIEGITGSAVVIEGHTAIIGLRLEEMEKKEVKTLIEQAERAAKNAEADIQTVSVTTKESIVTLIEKEEKKRSRL